jgi:type I restriction enzyme, S subunit
MSDDWETSSLIELLADHFSGTWGADPIPGGQNTTVLRSTDIDDEGHVNLATGAKRSLTSADLNAKRLRAGDILLEASGGGPGKPVGRPAWFSGQPGEEFVTSNFFKVLRAKSKVHHKFLLWQLLWLSSRPEIWRYQQQTTGIINLKFNDYLENSLRVPAFWEQQRVAEILDVLDEQIRATEQIIGKLCAVKRGLESDLFERGIKNYRQGHLTELSRWRDTTLGDEVDIISGGTPAKAVPSYWNGGIPWLTPKDMKSFVLEETADSLSPQGVAAGSHSVPAGAVFVVVRGMILAHTFPVSVVNTAAAFNQDIKALIAGPRLLPEFLAYWMSGMSSSMLRLVGESTHGTKKLDTPDLLAHPMRLPSREEQRGIVAVLRAIDAKIEGERACLLKLRLEKPGLMSDLLTGRIRVPGEVTS